MKKIFPIELDDSLHRSLKHAAIDAGVTLHDLILRILISHVNDHSGFQKEEGERGESVNGSG